MRRHLSYGREIATLAVAVVDSHQGPLKLMRSMLLGVGVGQVRLFESSTSGLDVLRSEGADILIVKDELPDMSGTEFVRRVRHRDFGAMCHMPIIVLTGIGRRATVEAAFLAGAHQVLVLPCSSETLSRRLRFLLADDRPFVADGARVRIAGVDEMIKRSKSVTWSAEPIAYDSENGFGGAQPLAEDDDAPAARPDEDTGEDIWAI